MGMGKNMVLSVRHWIKTLNLVTCTDKKTQQYELTDLAKKLFVGDDAYDEFLDKAEFTSELWNGYFHTYDGLLISAELMNNN